MARKPFATLNVVVLMSMDERIIERRIRCPFCAESMSILLDLSAGDQSYVEDCQVCCQPMQISFASSDEYLVSLQVACAN